MSSDALTETEEERLARIAAFDMPQALRDHLAGKSQPDGLVHWRGLASQTVATPWGIHTPTYCGRFAYDTMGYPLRYVTCPKCRELAEADGVPALLEQQHAEIAKAYGVPLDIPESLREAWRQIDEEG